MKKKFDIEKIGIELKELCPNILFAYLFGSSQKGIIQSDSDIDIAIYLADTNKKMNTLSTVFSIMETNAGNTPVDVIILNEASNFISFEALRGIKLFLREEAIDFHAFFYSITCREYESEKYWMQQQLRYRNYEVQWNN